MSNKLLSLLTIIMLVSTFNCRAFSQTTAEITKGNCKACAAECQKTLDYCAQQKGRYNEASVTAALKDCISACTMTQDLLARSSTLQAKAVAFCVDSCNNCAKSCESFKDDNAMRACADECRKCAGNCQKIKAGP
jgi:hypothetical protein